MKTVSIVSVCIILVGMVTFLPASESLPLCQAPYYTPVCVVGLDCDHYCRCPRHFECRRVLWGYMCDGAYCELI